MRCVASVSRLSPDIILVVIINNAARKCHRTLQDPLFLSSFPLLMQHDQPPIRTLTFPSIAVCYMHSASLTVPASPPCLELGAAKVGDKQKQGPRDRRRRITGHQHIRCHLIDCARPSLFRLKSRRAGSPKSQVSSPNPDRSHLHLTFPMDFGPSAFTAIPAANSGQVVDLIRGLSNT